MLDEQKKRAVTASVRVRNLGRNDLTVLYCVDLKLLGVSEVLKDLSVFISYCNFHNINLHFIIFFDLSHETGKISFCIFLGIPVAAFCDYIAFLHNGNNQDNDSLPPKNAPGVCDK